MFYNCIRIKTYFYLLEKDRVESHYRTPIRTPHAEDLCVYQN